LAVVKEGPGPRWQRREAYSHAEKDERRSRDSAGRLNRTNWGRHGCMRNWTRFNFLGRLWAAQPKEKFRLR